MNLYDKELVGIVDNLYALSETYDDLISDLDDDDIIDDIYSGKEIIDDMYGLCETLLVLNIKIECYMKKGENKND